MRRIQFCKHKICCKISLFFPPNPTTKYLLMRSAEQLFARLERDFRMAFWWRFCLLLLFFPPTAEALVVYDPRLCYILDGFLSLYGLVITAMFIKEKFFKTKLYGSYTDEKGQRAGGDLQQRGDPERGRNRWLTDNATYTGLKRQTDGDYKELPVKRERPRKNELIYQGLSSATRDTYDTLRMKQLPVPTTD
ncbi:T-cell surface glycoprotein CD3 zeta chain-like [Nerophis lumbriciformis]|uniref:T-cell surface glycoprotein CD3 zeta chain-like n=1 Tax=Nerophis lumbriciformis TaxID=546530 RepID=UPI002AE08479|nr:T-cell surface glycoprotein CD3 zeta chain-like [Nerophis lumbriciformis]